MPVDAIKSYVQLAVGLGETSRAKAKEAAQDIVALSGIEGSGKRKKAKKKVNALADDLLEAAQANRDMLTALVRKEVGAAVARVEKSTSREVATAQDAVAALQSQVDALAATVRGLGTSSRSGDASSAPAATESAATSSATHASGTAAAAKKAPAKKAPAKKAPADSASSRA